MNLITLSQTKQGITRNFSFSDSSIKWYVTAMGKDSNTFLKNYTSADVDLLLMNCNYTTKTN